MGRFANETIIDIQNHEILSKTAIHVLCIIWNNPINPYAIAKLINYKRKIIRRPIHIQTVYSIVKALHRKRLITVKRSKNGRMPDRNVYSITEKGEELVKFNLISLLSKPAEPLSEFSLGLFAVGNLDKETVLTALKKYRNEISRDIDIRKKLYAEEKERGVTYYHSITIEHTMEILKLNRNTASKLIEKLEADSEWSPAPIPFWRNEVV